MLQKTIRKDVIGEYEAKLVAGLSKRKLIACASACAIGVGVSVLLGTCWQVDSMTSAYAGVILTIPVWYLGFFKPNDMQPEDFLPLWLEERSAQHELPFISECSDELEAHIEKVRRHAGSDKRNRKRGRRLPEWLSRPASRRGLRYRRSVWKAHRELARAEKAVEGGSERGQSAREGTGTVPQS